MDDSELLARYINTGSADAFNQLMVRHVDLVYGAARRQVHDVHLAEDITQAVFILLSQKAKSIRSGGVLPGWLLLTTNYAAKDALKIEFRRRVREYKVAQMRTGHDKDQDQAWLEGAPELDGALAKLPGRQRSIVALHYMEGRTFREVGQTLGMSEDAARMACGRAVEKLRDSLNRPALGSAATLGMLLASKGTQATPEALRNLIAANSATGVGASTKAIAIARSVATGMSLKIGAPVLIALVTIISASIITSTVLTSKIAKSNSNRIQIGDHLPVDGNGITFATGGRIEFLGLAHYPNTNGTWWQANGSAPSISPPGLSASGTAGRVDSDRSLYQFALRASDLPADAGALSLYAAGDFPGIRTVHMQRAPAGDENIYYGIAALSPQQAVTNVAIALSIGGTESLRLDAQGHPMGITPDLVKTFVPFTIADGMNQTLFTLPFEVEPYLKYDFTAIALATDGTEHPRLISANPYQGQIGDNSHRTVFTFDLAPQNVREFRITSARTRQWIVFRHVALAPGAHTDPFAENSRNPSVDRSGHDKEYLVLIGNLVAAIKKQDIAKASSLCDRFVANTRDRATSLEGTPYSYLIADGQPVLDQLHAAIQRHDLPTALTLVDAGQSSGARLWNMTLQLAINNHVESLQYP